MAAEKDTMDFKEDTNFVRKLETHSDEKVFKDFLMALHAYRNGCGDLVDE